MFQTFFSQFLLVINFIAQKIMTLQIANITLLQWIVVLVLVAGLVTLIFKLRPVARIKSRRNYKNNNESSEE